MVVVVIVIVRGNYSIFYLIISIFMVVWLGIDFWGTYSTGETFMMRVDGKMLFSQSPFLFILAIIVKLIVMVYSLLYVFEGVIICYEKCFLQRYQQQHQKNKKKKINKSLKKKRGY